MKTRQSRPGLVGVNGQSGRLDSFVYREFLAIDQIGHGCITVAFDQGFLTLFPERHDGRIEFGRFDPGRSHSEIGESQLKINQPDRTIAEVHQQV